MSIKISYPIEPIDININDNGKFADMAYFFDRLDVLTDIADLRKRWIGDRLIPHDKVEDFTNEHDDKAFWDNFTHCRKIAKKYTVGATYVKPIISATLSGTIDDLDYSTTFEEYPVDNIPEDLRLDEKVAYSSSRIRSVDIKKKKKDNKSISSVKTYREWYWLYHKMGYRKIEKETHDNLETIRSGIRAYTKALRTYYPVVK